MENKKTIFTLIFCLILVLIGTLINKLVFKSNDETIDKGKNYNEFVSRGYTLVNLDKKSKLNLGYKIITKDDKEYISNNNKISLELINNNLSFIYNDTKYNININNVIDYYMFTKDEIIYVYVLNNNYELYYSYYKFNINESIIDIINNLNNNFNKINTDKKITNLKKIVTVYKLLDNSNYEYLVCTSLDKKEYIINNDKIEDEIINNNYFDKVYYFNDDVFVLDNSKLMIGNQDSLFNVKYILGDYFVSYDNYLYKVNNKNITKEYNNKIQYMFYYKYDNIFKLAFIFDDNSVKQIDLIVSDYDYEIQGIDIEVKK